MVDFAKLNRERRSVPDPKATSPQDALPWHLKYRPTTLGDVVGQKEVVNSIKGALISSSIQHTFFLFGPGGTGKTTLARIMATDFACEPSNIIEIDAATKSGIDDMREVIEGLAYLGFGARPNKAYIVDECHGLSKAAWTSLLKSTEEPPAHVFFFFCSTDPAKIPSAMLTRGPNYQLQPVRIDPLLDLLEFVCGKERLDTGNAILNEVARACNGSPRQALVMLAMVAHETDPEAAASLLQQSAETKEVIDLCRALVNDNLKWTDVQRLLEPIADQGAEGIRIQVTLYLAKALMGKHRNTGLLLDMLDAFSRPCNPTDKLAPLLLAFGRFTKG